MQKPYSESCDQNKDHILSVIQPILSSSLEILEVGSGTGQHAIYFASKMPHLRWHCSDCLSNISGINQWLNDCEISNVIEPFTLDVSISDWPTLPVDAIFTANSIHIMHPADVINMFSGAGELLKERGDFIIYGPFNYNGSYTSASNQSFDRWLKGNDPKSGIKDFEEMQRLAEINGFRLARDHEMPANNRILHYIKI